MVAHDPLHGSGRAAFPHPALASGNDPKSPQGIRMTDAGRRQPTANEPLHPVPANTAGLATSRQRAVPGPTDLKPKQVEGPIVRRDPIVAEVSLDHRAQPLTHFRDGVVHAPPELGLHFAQLGQQPLTRRLPQHGEASVSSRLPTDVGEAEEIERFGLPLATPLSVFSREPAEFQEPGLLGMQLQMELPNSLG